MSSQKERRVSPTELVRVVEALLMPVRAEMTAIGERQAAIQERQVDQEKELYETRKILFALHERLDRPLEVRA